MNTRPHLLVADIGTSSLKAGIIDRTGNLIWSYRHPLLTHETQLRQWDPQIWSDGLKAVGSCLPAEPIDGIVFSGNGPTLVPLDANRRPTAPVLLWIDGNSHWKPSTDSFYLPKTAWFQAASPEAFRKTRRFLSCPEYLSFLLTGEEASISPQPDFDRFLWDQDQIRAYGLSPELFPTILRPGSCIGVVTDQASSEFGLPRGVRVFAGGSDFMMSLIGTGCIEPGMTCDRAGTSEGINYCSPGVVENSQVRCLPHAISGLYNVAGILSSTGRIFEWFRRFSGQSTRSYEEMIKDIEAVQDWSDQPFFYPAVHEGERFDFNHASFTNLSPVHGSAEMGRAVVEAIGFTIRQVKQILHDVGCSVDTLRVCGGQAKNLRWNQMKANMINSVIEIPKIQDAELLGCAIEGFIGLKEFHSYREAVDELVKIEYVIKPQSSWVPRYEQRFEQYELGFRSIAEGR